MEAMERTIIKQMHDQWLTLKQEAVRQCEQRNLLNVAEAYRKCKMFTGEESLAQLAALYKSPQGVEFCMRYHFPNLATLRLFKKDRPERFGIYIDAGHITIDNPTEKIILVGRTTAVVNCTERRNYNVVCLHSARAIVNAAGWSVVRVETEIGCNVVRNLSENAIIL